MKRLLSSVSMAALALGCQNGGWDAPQASRPKLAAVAAKPPDPKSMEAKAMETPVAAKPAPTPPVAAPAAKPVSIFEQADENKIYVFGSASSRQSFVDGGLTESALTKKEGLGRRANKTVYFENGADDLQGRLEAAWVKDHPAEK